MPQQGENPRRWVDFESTPLTPFEPLLYNHSISLLGEAKNVCRVGQCAQILHKDAINQIIGNLAKRTLVAFDIGDVGINSISVGIVLTTVYMQVIRLRLSNMGKENVELKIERTRVYPLVTRQAFEKIVTKDEDREYLQSQLFPAEDEESDCPEGIIRLWELLHSSDTDLYMSFFGRPNQKAIFEGDRGKLVIGGLLGSGSQGLVYAVDANDREGAFVVKASVAGETIHIKREIEALRKLSRSIENRCPYIPTLKDRGCVEYSVRQTVAKVPAILLAPKGVPAREYLRSLAYPDEKDLALLTLWKNALEALDFAHGMDVFHLDVSPRNFIRHGDRFVLMDWACAVVGPKKARGFRGTLAFAHAQVHQKENIIEWTPKAAHDKAPLLFTIFALYEDNMVPWPEFSQRRSGNDQAFATRRDKTKIGLHQLIQAWKNRTDLGETKLYGQKIRSRATLQNCIINELKNA